MAALRASEDDLASLIGRSIRTARLAARWKQAELARRLGTTQSAVSRLETGSSSCIDIRLASAAFRLLGIRTSVDSATIGLVGRREQSDFVHARCSSYVASRLRADQWEVGLEVEVGSGRYRGWIDLLAFRAIDRALFCGEIKTELDDLGRIQRTVSWYEREAWEAARRMGWRPRSITIGLLVLCSSENDARVVANAQLLDRAFPGRARDLGAWLTTAGTKSRPSSLAMIDPRSRRIDWLRATISDGRRSTAPYENDRAAADALRRR
jgi:transcriptional regulator with XRE-family HTH domain